MKKTVIEYMRIWHSSVAFRESLDITSIMSEICKKKDNGTITINDLLEVYKLNPNPWISFELIEYYHRFANQPEIAKTLYKEFEEKYGELEDFEIYFLNLEPTLINYEEPLDPDIDLR